VRINAPSLQIEYVKSIISNLPEANQETLHWLIVFLSKVAQNSQVNKMDMSNLATMFGPNLIRSKMQTATQMLGDLPSVRIIMLIIMRNYKFIFEVCRIKIIIIIIMNMKLIIILLLIIMLKIGI
jgi:hypothetical protein